MRSVDKKRNNRGVNAVKANPGIPPDAQFLYHMASTIMAMSASFGPSFYVPASHAYDGKTMNFEGEELTCLQKAGHSS